MPSPVVRMPTRAEPGRGHGVTPVRRWPLTDTTRIHVAVRVPRTAGKLRTKVHTASTTMTAQVSHRGIATAPVRPVTVRNHAAVAKGSIMTSIALCVRAVTKCPCARSWRARRLPQPGHAYPVMARNGHVG